MESSTTVPITNTSANSVRMLILKPAICMAAKVPTNETMMEMDGISVLLKSCKKKYTTKITRMMAITNVSTTSWIEANKKSLELIIVMNSRPSGSSSLISDNNLEISAFTSVAFEPATWNTIKVQLGCPSTLLSKAYD